MPPPDDTPARPARPTPADDIAALGAAVSEGEGAHLLRVARELSSDALSHIVEFERLLADPRSDRAACHNAALQLGALDDRHAIAVLRRLLESDDPGLWELGVSGLRGSRARPGWLCLESVARDQIPALGSGDPERTRVAASRLLMMGRTKTMDRLFRAADGHSRSIPRRAAAAFVHAALGSLDGRARAVMELRLGVSEGRSLTPMTPVEVAAELGIAQDVVRSLEADAWLRIQSPRRYDEIIGTGD